MADLSLELRFREVTLVPFIVMDLFGDFFCDFFRIVLGSFRFSALTGRMGVRPITCLHIQWGRVFGSRDFPGLIDRFSSVLAVNGLQAVHTAMDVIIVELILLQD